MKECRVYQKSLLMFMYIHTCIHVATCTCNLFSMLLKSIIIIILRLFSGCSCWWIYFRFVVVQNMCMCCKCTCVVHACDESMWNSMNICSYFLEP